MAQLTRAYPGCLDDLKRLQQVEKVNQELRNRIVSLETIKTDDDECAFWTGMPNFEMFMAVFNWLQYKAKLVTYWRGHKQTKEKVTAAERKLSLDEEFLLVMVRLKVGLMVFDLAKRFGVSTGTVSSICTTWVNLMYVELREWFELPDPHVLKDQKSEAFKNFPTTHMVIDCTEIFCETPEDLKEKKHMYSDYKHHQTFKFLIGMSTHPAIVYVSRMYGGRASDMLITSEASDFIEASRLAGGKVMADRGFTGTYKMTPLGVDFVTPVFKGIDRCQLTAKEVEQSAECSNARIHVERIIQRIKTFHILDGEVRMTMKNMAEQIFCVCAYLTNFQSPILKK